MFKLQIQPVQLPSDLFLSACKLKLKHLKRKSHKVEASLADVVEWYHISLRRISAFTKDEEFKGMVNTMSHVYCVAPRHTWNSHRRRNAKQTAIL